jgi:protein-S-isoprenylcysteine O-methyltransferase Ste14
MAVYLLQLVSWTAFMAVLILWPAGTFAYAGAWGFIALFLLGGAVTIVWLSKHSPSLLRERMALPVQRSQKPWDRVFMTLMVLAFFGWVAFMGWDAARTGFAAVPPWLQVAGGIFIVIEMLGVWWTFRENSFAAPVVKIQEGQRVIDTGPYAIVRHPMYTSATFFFLGLPLLLGSWAGLAFSPVLVLAVGWRAVREERMLRAELSGYDGYADRVRYRFIPNVW